MPLGACDILPACSTPKNPSPQLRTALAWIAGYNAWDVDLICDQLSSERYEHWILPISLNQPVRNKEEYRGYMRETVKMFKEFKVTIHEIIESPGKIVLHASSRAVSATSHTYTNEYMLVLHVNDASKITAVKEFVDSHYALAFFPAERERIRKMKESERGATRK